MDCQIWRFIIKPKQRSNPQVTIDRMNIERGNGNTMSVRDPGTFAGAAPAVVRNVLEIVLGRDCPREFDRPIKSNADTRAANQREQSRTHLAMHIDHQIIFCAPDLFEKIEKAQHRAPSLAPLREVATRKEDHIREG